MRPLRLLLVALLAVACSPGGDAPDLERLPPRTPKIARRATEADRVVVRHLLLGCAGSAAAVADRTPEETRLLAETLCSRIRAGDDMEALVREHSGDFDPDAEGPPGIYRIANVGVAPAPGELPREHLARGFGDLAFSLAVGDVEVLQWSREASPLGFHVLRRLE